MLFYLYVFTSVQNIENKPAESLEIAPAKRLDAVKVITEFIKSKLTRLESASSYVFIVPYFVLVRSYMCMKYCLCNPLS
jgi:hypothetical protein